MKDRIDWTRLAAVASYYLGWSADQFWQATPQEFWVATKIIRCQFEPRVGSPITRDELDLLFEKFPDQPSPITCFSTESDPE